LAYLGELFLCSANNTSKQHYSDRLYFKPPVGARAMNASVETSRATKTDT
jgi:hypothetical protein